MTKGYVVVKEWLRDKIHDEAFNYHMTLVYQSNENNENIENSLRVEEVLKETEKAIQVKLDAETFGGNVKTWTAWVAKSCIVENHLRTIA